MDCDCGLDPRKTSKRALKEQRKHKHLEWCGSCGRSSGVDKPTLSTCARCHNVRYCSRDCQKKHWPSHKFVCTEDRTTHLSALVKNISANILIQDYLVMCAALQLGFDKEDETNPASHAALRAKSTTLHLRLDMTIAPCNAEEYLIRILGLRTDRLADAHVDGMLQFQHMSVRPADGAAPHLLRGAHMTREKLDMLTPDIVDTSDWVIIAIDMANGPTHLACCLPYRLGSLTEALNTKKFAHVDPNASAEVNVAKSLKHLNKHIEADKENVHMLRCPMRKYDKAVYLGACLSIADTWIAEQK